MKGSFVGKIITFVGVLVALFYFGYTILTYLVDPLTTTIAYQYRSDDAVTVSGYLVRQEQVIAGTGDLVYVTRSEGEKVSAGGSVAVLFRSQEALDQAQQLQRLEEQLEQLEFAQSVSSGSQEVLKLDDNIMDAIFALRASAASGDVSDLGTQTSSLRAMILKRDYTYSGMGEGSQMEEQIAQLEEQIRSLRSSAQSGSSRVTTTVSGIFSALVDGYESVLTPEMLETLTPSSLRAIQSAQTDVNAVGKIITGNTWYYATTMRTGDIEKMEEGDTVTLRFVNGLEKDLEMTVYLMGAEENGQQIVVLSSDEYLSNTTLLRHQNAQVIYQSYSGIRVPKGALRVGTETLVGEDGDETTVSVTGVYCRMGLVARLKPVTVLYQGEDYYLVEPATDQLTGLSETQKESRILRSGDEIIISANDLYDGKVIGE